MAYRARYIDGVRISGVPSNVKRIQSTRRAPGGAVSFTAAPVTKFTKTGLSLKTTGGTATKYTKTTNFGLTGLVGHDGVNYIYGKFYWKNTAAAKNTVALKAKTLGGTTTLVATSPVAKTNTKTFSAALPWDVPGSLILAVKPAAGKLTTVRVKNISVNALTTLMW